MISFYILSKRFFLKRERLSDARLASITEKEYGFAIHFLQRFIKSFETTSNERLYAICLSSLSFGIFLIKKCVVFSLTSFGTLKHDCVIKAREIFHFLPLINSAVTILLRFSLLCISVIISLFGLPSSIFS